MGFGLIVVGDEILSGRRQDKHFSKVVELLGARGLQLGWAEFVGDDPPRLTAILRRSFAGGDIVRGASLVVWGVRDGRDAAEGIHAHLQARAPALALAS